MLSSSLLAILQSFDLHPWTPLYFDSSFFSPNKLRTTTMMTILRAKREREGGKHHYARAGLKTCLVIQSQDPTADYLLNCKVGTSSITCNNNLSAVKLETTKMLIEPLNRLKQANARLNMTQGVLEGVVGEELGVLPGMDSLFSALALQRLVGFSRNASQRNQQENKFDVIVYDSISTEETNWNI
ncbi:Uncharacterized protein LOK49_LG05G01772 [Camellia lanceoleosa]|uniref:Uncharacterized protein n=1 Tax=Camellia lanceoleosa TaxID=1840588 RepID=A0ACC0HM94_9ERIC|nr:Uncharacterized protein LOK49_LG05G01772 [Camellia lanceoleosa]